MSTAEEERGPAGALLLLLLLLRSPADSGVSPWAGVGLAAGSPDGSMPSSSANGGPWGYKGPQRSGDSGAQARHWLVARGYEDGTML